MTMTETTARGRQKTAFTLDPSKPVPVKMIVEEMTERGLKQVIASQVDYPVRRFGINDVQDMGLWILECLKPDYPHLTEQTLAGWLRGCMENNEYCFVRTANAVGLAVRGSKTLESRPTVDEVFVLARAGHNDEAGAIYGQFRSWAKGINASEMHVGYNSDFTLAKIKAVLGPIKERVWHVVELA